MSFKTFDTFGTITGIIGAIIIALNLGYNPIGYIFFTISTIFYILWALKRNRNILILNITFLIINIIGLIRYI